MRLWFLLLFLCSGSVWAYGRTSDDEKQVRTWNKLLDRAASQPDSCIKAATRWLAEVKGDAKWESKAYVALGKAQFYSSVPGTSVSSMEKALLLPADEEAKGMAYYYMAMVPYNEKKYDEAISFFEKSIPQLEKAGESWLRANAHFLLGFSYSTRKDISGAREHYQKASALFEKYVDTKVLGDTYSFWGDLEYYEAKDYAGSADLYARSAKVYKGAGLKSDAAYFSHFAADVYRMLKQPETALNLYFDALDYYTEIKDKKKSARIAKAVGELYYEAGNNEDAAKFLLDAAALQHGLGSLADEGDCYIVLANMYYFSGNYPNALTYFRKSLDCFEKAGSLGGQAGSYVGLGNFYQSRGDFGKALDMYDKSIALYKQDGGKNYSGMSSAYTGMGNCYYSQRDYDKALEYYLLSYDTEGKQDKSVADQSVALINIANIYINKKDGANAEKYLDLAIQEAERTNNKHRQAAAYKLRGYYYNQQKESQKAFDDCSGALKVTEELGLLPEVMECYRCMYYAMSDMGKFSEALEYYQLYIATRDSINNEKRNNEINRRELRYEYEKKETALRMEEEKKQLALQEELKRKQLMFQFESRQAALKAEAEKKELAMDEELKRKELALEYEKQQALARLERDKKDLEHARILEKKDIEHREQKRLTNWLLAGLALFGILTFIILKGYRDKKKANTIILQQKEETEKQKEIIELKSLQLEEKNREIVDSITYARRLQEAILPPHKLVKQYLNDSFILYKPRDIVAGDFYWMETVHLPGKENGHTNSLILFAVADCTGHGVPGAMVSVVCSGALNRAVKEFKLTDPGLILNKVREMVIETFEKSESEVKDGMDISLCVLEITEPPQPLRKTGKTPGIPRQTELFNDGAGSIKLQWAGANNPLWILRHHTPAIEEIKADKQPIGMTDHPKPFTTHTVELSKGDIVYLSSDGYADQFGGEKGKKLKDANLKKLLLEIYRQPMEEQVRQLNQAFEHWRGGLEQVDDVCIIGVRV